MMVEESVNADVAYTKGGLGSQNAKLYAIKARIMGNPTYTTN